MDDKVQAKLVFLLIGREISRATAKKLLFIE
jgi:hypothetical protein